ncbi:nucleoporin p54-like isoform X1 [Harmonia axyridis]|uniref:nucleoporin p54-like isoform X1 n=1 Tax=Harmonia axyridis TaxID=115357 RepID=UPI001E27972E|nr:nucleoporin p54-like isoform X1 [Harmonia axyridis]
MLNWAPGFGTAFSSTPATTANTGFSFGSTPAFGASQTPAFGATAQPTPAFGATAQNLSFGATAQTPGFGAAQPTGFGAAAQTSAFGATGQTPAFGASAQTPAFGSTSQTPAFGATAAPAFGATSQTSGFGSSFGASATPAFGSTFGAPATSAPAFGSTFGATATSTPSFGFGTSTSTASGGLFAATASKPSLFGAPASSAPSLFSTPGTGGTGLFGTTTTSQAPSLFATSTTPSLFGTTTTPSLFGTNFNTGSTGTGLFGNTTAPSSNLFSGFGSTATSTGFTGFGGTTGFGATSTAPSLFGPSVGAPFGAKPQEQQNQDTHLQQVLASFYAVNIFNDERDDIIKKWNMLQASWGNGKGYYGQNQNVQYSNANPLFRFKAVGYNIIIDADNSEGMVKLTFNKKEAEIRAQKDAIVNGISGILGNKPNLTVVIDDTRGMNENQTEVRIVVSEKGVTGTSRRIPATDLASFLNQPAQKQQLTNVGVTHICAFVTPSKSDLEEYLSKPPPGIDNQMWEAAKIDNPNPKKYMPIAINGFTDLKNRMHNQEYETGLHKAFLQKVDKDISELRKKHASSIAQITDLKQKFLQLQHRILRVLVKQECTRKVGFTIQPEEELLKGRLETLNAHLNTPTQFKGQLIELMSCIKTVGNIGRQYNEHYNIDPQVQEDIKQFLQMEQTGISHLINIINTDLQALKIISEGMNQCLKAKAPIL